MSLPGQSCLRFSHLIEYKLNWIIFNNKRYLITVLPLNGEYRLTVPGERCSVILDRQQMTRAVKKSLGLSVKSQVEALLQTVGNAA